MNTFHFNPTLNAASFALNNLKCVDADEHVVSSALAEAQRNAADLGSTAARTSCCWFCLDISKVQKSLLPSLKRVSQMIQSYLPQVELRDATHAQ